MNPVLKYRGGKSREIPNFLRYVPDEFDTYVEPFFGGGALYFYLEPENAIINDVNSKLIEFYTDLRDNYNTMRFQLDYLQDMYEKNQKEYKTLKEISTNDKDKVPNKNEELYYNLRKLFNYPDGSYLNSVLYYFINKTAYSGMIRYNNSGEFNVPFGRYPNFNTKLLKKEHSDLLKGSEIYNEDYSDIFAKAKVEDFIFLDPPYDCVFNDYGNVDLMDGFNEDQHRRLANDFENLNSKSLMIIGKTPLTEELYGKYIIDEYYKNYAVNIKNRFNNDSIHIVVSNYLKRP